MIQFQRSHKSSIHALLDFASPQVLETCDKLFWSRCLPHFVNIAYGLIVGEFDWKQKDGPAHWRAQNEELRGEDSFPKCTFKPPIRRCSRWFRAAFTRLATNPYVGYYAGITYFSISEKNIMLASEKKYEVLGKLQAGIPEIKIARSSRVSVTEIAQVKAEFAAEGALKPPTPGQRERAERRKQMAEAVRDGKSVAEVAKEFKMSTLAVKKACNAFGVAYSTQYTDVTKASVYAVLTKLVQEFSQTEIASEFNVSRQCVNAIFMKAQLAGLWNAIEKRIKSGK